ncbi:MAG: Lrp/AsnC ligand binding domain-containing protein [Thermoplasmatales archaeon]|nr:MAG: Lrp/AsnC ligand binding domain-containing protein [Thermoplasmatales archaeon]
MAVAFVLITAVTAHEQAVYKELSKIPEIIELHPLLGEYDLLAKIEADNFDNLGTIVVNKIRSIEGVRFTTTFTETKF